MTIQYSANHLAGRKRALERWRTPSFFWRQQPNFLCKQRAWGRSTFQYFSCEIHIMQNINQIHYLCSFYPEFACHVRSHEPIHPQESQQAPEQLRHPSPSRSSPRSRELLLSARVNDRKIGLLCRHWISMRSFW